MNVEDLPFHITTVTIWVVLEVIHILGMAEQSVRSGNDGWWWCYSLELNIFDVTWQTLRCYWMLLLLVTMVFYPAVGSD